MDARTATVARDDVTVGAGPATRGLLTLAGGLPGERVSLGAIVDRLGTDGLGFVLLLLTLPTLIPVPGPFGMVFGALIALVALQLVSGRRTLWLPERLRRRTLPTPVLRGVIAQSLPWIARIEGWLREDRLPALTGQRARAVLAVPLLLLALAIVLPIPLGNVAPATALIVFALGFLARDGGMILVALALSLAALAWTGFLLVAGASALTWLLAALGLA